MPQFEISTAHARVAPSEIDALEACPNSMSQLAGMRTYYLRWLKAAFTHVGSPAASPRWSDRPLVAGKPGLLLLLGTFRVCRPILDPWELSGVRLRKRIAF